LSETAPTKATCPYCGVGCGVLIEQRGGKVVNVRGDPDHPANFGRLCTKGATLHLSAGEELRLAEPKLRHEPGGPAEPLAWSSAIDVAATRFASAIRAYGPDSVGFYISGQLLTEDYYVFNKLAKGLIGTNNVDTNSRLCMSSAVAAYKQTLGADAPPCCYEDFDHTDCILISGANPAFAHPIAFRRIEDAKARNPDLFMIVVDPRRTDTASSADLHLAIAPGSDIILCNAMLRVFIEDGLIDHDYIARHTENFKALRAHVLQTSVDDAARACEIAPALLIEAARRFGQAKRPMSLWCQGLNQSHHGTHNGTSLIALSMALGKIGQPGCGPFSLTGQPNAMGGREVGGLSNLLPAHRDLSKASDRAEVARFWGIESVPEKPGYSAVEMFEAAASGKLKALWIACTNPAHSMPDQARIKKALEFCDFVVLQDAFENTETARYADLLLPAAAWAEKEGAVTNSERRITHVKPAISAFGMARPDWRIACDFALALGEKLGRSDAPRLFPYISPSEIFDEHVTTTLGRDLDIGGLSYEVLDRLGPQQWPMPRGASVGQARLYADGVFQTVTGRARFVVPVEGTTSEQSSKVYRFHLTTGRLRDQWHGMSRTGNVAQLMNHSGEPRIELAGADMSAEGIADGDLVEVTGRRGRLVLPAAASEQLRPGHAFVAMHWGANVLNSAGANALMSSVFDPFSKQPELKHVSVAIKSIALPHRLVLMRTELDAASASSLALTRARQVKEFLASVPFASLSVAGRERPTVILRMASGKPFDTELLGAVDRIFGFDHATSMHYSDQACDVDKRAVTTGHKLLGIRFVNETAATSWLREVIVEQQSIEHLRRSILAPLARSPSPVASRGTIICNCLNVGSHQIDAVLAEGADLPALQARLGCGTSCGSCLPELRKRVALGERVVSLLAA
jgi:assimilatory nitrate reductase catalytic subunit